MLISKSETAINFCTEPILVMDFLFPLRKDCLLGRGKKKAILEMLMQTENPSYAGSLLKLIQDVQDL